MASTKKIAAKLMLVALLHLKGASAASIPSTANEGVVARVSRRDTVLNPEHCHAGYEWIDMTIASFCEPCPAGTWQSEYKSKLPCKPKALCDAGTYFVDNPYVERSCEPCPANTEQPLDNHMKETCNARETCAPGSTMGWPDATLVSTTATCSGCRKNYKSGLHYFCETQPWYLMNENTTCNRIGCAFPPQNVTPELCQFRCELDERCEYFSVGPDGACEHHLVDYCNVQTVHDEPTGNVLYRTAAAPGCITCAQRTYQPDHGTGLCKSQPACGENTHFVDSQTDLRQCIPCSHGMHQPLTSHFLTSCKVIATSTETTTTASTSTGTVTSTTTATESSTTVTTSSPPPLCMCTSGILSGGCINSDGRCLGFTGGICPHTYTPCTYTTTAAATATTTTTIVATIETTTPYTSKTATSTSAATATTFTATTFTSTAIIATATATATATTTARSSTPTPSTAATPATTTSTGAAVVTSPVTSSAAWSSTRTDSTRSSSTVLPGVAAKTSSEPSNPTASTTTSTKMATSGAKGAEATLSSTSTARSSATTTGTATTSTVPTDPMNVVPDTKTSSTAIYPMFIGIALVAILLLVVVGVKYRRRVVRTWVPEAGDAQNENGRRNTKMFGPLNTSNGSWKVNDEARQDSFGESRSSFGNAWSPSLESMTAGRESVSAFPFSEGEYVDVVNVLAVKVHVAESSLNVALSQPPGGLGYAHTNGPASVEARSRHILNASYSYVQPAAVSAAPKVAVNDALHVVGAERRPTIIATLKGQLHRPHPEDENDLMSRDTRLSVVSL